MLVKIYVLKDPTTLEIRYIGRTKNSLKVRLTGHCSKSKQNQFKTHKDNWILSLSQKPIIELLETIEGWEESYKREQEIIKDFILKGYRLTNLHDRGTGGLLRDVSEEMKKKISEKVKELHNTGRLSCNRKAVDVYDLQGIFLENFDSYTKCAEFIGIGTKQLESSMQRKAKRVRQYQVLLKGSPSPGVWKQRTGEITKNFKPIYMIDISTREVIKFEAVKRFKDMFGTGASTVNYYVNTKRLYKGRYLIANARVKLDELLGSLEADNQQPSLGNAN